MVKKPSGGTASRVRELIAPTADELGYMLWDMDYSDPENIRPLFFRAQLQNGILHIPTREEVVG